MWLPGAGELQVIDNVRLDCNGIPLTEQDGRLQGVRVVEYSRAAVFSPYMSVVLTHVQHDNSDARAWKTVPTEGKQRAATRPNNNTQNEPQSTAKLFSYEKVTSDLPAPSAQQSLLSASSHYQSSKLRNPILGTQSANIINCVDGTGLFNMSLHLYFGFFSHTEFVRWTQAFKAVNVCSLLVRKHLRVWSG